MRFACLAALLLWIGSVVSARGQASTGKVSGMVIAGDTQRPARLATVAIFRSANLDHSLAGKLDEIGAETGPDGSYTINSVPPGEYYVFASAGGYQSLKGTMQAALDAGADFKQALPLPMIRVVANQTTRADLTMERGAAISGTVSWDDGSPINEARVTVERLQEEKELPNDLSGFAYVAGDRSEMQNRTDDLGHFRVSGLLPGDYVLQVRIPMSEAIAMTEDKFDASRGGRSGDLVVWAPSAFHRSEAKPVTLTAGAEVHGEQISIALDGTHSVSGHVEALDTHTSVNSAMVELTDQSDAKLTRRAEVDSNGDFTVMFVPQGTYDVAVTRAEIQERKEKQDDSLAILMHNQRSFQQGHGKVVVGDTDVLQQNFDLKPKTKADKDDD